MRAPFPLGLLCILASLGCDASTTVVVPPLDADDVVEWTLEDDAMLSDVLTGEFMALVGAASGASTGGSNTAPVETTSTLDRSLPCPAGGHTRIQATVIRVQDPVAGSTSVDVSGSRSAEGCVRALAGGSVSIQASETFEAFRRQVDGGWAGPQTLTRSGELLAEGPSGARRECDYDLRRVFDPDSGRTSVAGSVCGRSVSRTLPSPSA